MRPRNKLKLSLSPGQHCVAFDLLSQESDTTQTVLAGEEQLLELISTDVPLSLVLDKVCTALDVELGNIMSVALFLDDEDHFSHELSRLAALFGLSIFSTTAILSQSGQLLGTLETYCCCSRSPTTPELNLIERAAQIAALAIQLRSDAGDSGAGASSWNSTLRPKAPKGTLPGN